jgi:hypothetical protein
MASFWPWLAIAAAGALHGLNPAAGWVVAAAWGLRAGPRAALRALAPIALGHGASTALVAGAAALGAALDRPLALALAGIGIAAVAITRLAGRRPRAAGGRLGQAGLALWSFVVSTAHGAGLMLVPALIPLCAAGGRAEAPAGPVTLALAAVVLHTAAMLATVAALAAVACIAKARVRSQLLKP